MKKRTMPFRASGKMIMLALATTTAVYSCKKITEKDYGGTGSTHPTAITRSADDNLNNELLHARTENLVAVIWNQTADEWDQVKPNNSTEAIDYMEAVLNYTHGNAGVDNELVQTYQQDFTLEADADGTYSLAGYTASFNAMSDYIVGIYNNVESTEKNVFAVKLTPGYETASEVTLTFYLGVGKWQESTLRTFGSPVNDIYKYDKVSGQCMAGGPDGACRKLEDHGNYNMKWYRSQGGTLARQAGYYAAVGQFIIDITNIPLLTGPNRPASFTAGFLDFQVFAYDKWKGMVDMPCLNMDQMNYYLSQINPLFKAGVAGYKNREFVNLTVNPKYKSGGSFTNLVGWGNPGARGLNTTGPVGGGGDVVTKAHLNASGKGTYYEHYYIFDYGRYILSPPQSTYRKL